MNRLLAPKFCVFLLVLLPVIEAADYQVPGDYATIEEAIGVSRSGDRIIVAPGVHVATGSMLGGTTLMSSGGAGVTTIEISGSGLTIGHGATLTGFTIRSAEGARFAFGAIHVREFARPVGTYIADNIFEGIPPTRSGFGASITLINAWPVIERNIFRGAASDGFARDVGVIGIVGRSSPLIINNIFHDNGIPAIHARVDNPDSSSQPPPMPTIVNNTMVRNAKGVVLDVNRYQVDFVFRNNLITECPIGLEVTGNFGFGVWEHNLVDAQTPYVGTPSLTGQDGNIAGDPLLTNSAANDFTISKNSPAVDAGTNVTAPSFDFLVNNRPLDGDGNSVAVADIGAYETPISSGIGIFLTGGLEHECNTTGGAFLEAYIETVPSDLEIRDLSITINGQEVADTAPSQIFVPLGTSELGVSAMTLEGEAIDDSTEVVVRDTMAPEIEAWFEDRRSGERVEAITSRRLSQLIVRIEADDVCDPDPETSSVIGYPTADGRLLRYQGNKALVSLNADTMTLSVTATDTSGNTSSLTKVLDVVIRPRNWRDVVNDWNNP